MRRGIGAPQSVLMPCCGYESRDGLEQRSVHPVENRCRGHIARDSVSIFTIPVSELREIVVLRRPRVRRPR
eukprot:12141005-Alexandrium_andersonii.AAC.1